LEWEERGGREEVLERRRKVGVEGRLEWEADWKGEGFGEGP
jgi:hypothetical protein